MSNKFRLTGQSHVPTYDDGRTKQSFKDATDIRKILAKAQVTGTVSHMAKFQPEYGDFAEFDFLQAQLQLARGKEIFDQLPSEVRREFNQDPANFFKFVNDPENSERLGEVLPEIAKLESYFPRHPSKEPAGAEMPSPTAPPPSEAAPPPSEEPPKA